MKKYLISIIKPFIESFWKSIEKDLSEIIQSHEQNMFTEFDLVIQKNIGLYKKIGFANLSFKPSPGDEIEFDETISKGEFNPDRYFIFKVKEVRYSHHGFTGRLLGEIIQN